MCNRGDRKLLAVEGVGHRVHWPPHDMSKSKEIQRHLKCINFSASDRTTLFFKMGPKKLST